MLTFKPGQKNRFQFNLFDVNMSFDFGICRECARRDGSFRNARSRRQLASCGLCSSPDTTTSFARVNTFWITDNTYVRGVRVRMTARRFHDPKCLPDAQRVLTFIRKDWPRRVRVLTFFENNNVARCAAFGGGRVYARQSSLDATVHPTRGLQVKNIRFLKRESF